MYNDFRKSVVALALCFSTHLAALETGSLPSPQQGQSSTQTSTQPSTQQKKEEKPVQPFIPHPRPMLPPTMKPFGMPGVVGLQNHKWAGTDYLGYVSNHIAVDVEVLKGQNVPETIEASALEQRVRTILARNDITPETEVVEGPPLPFLHILLFIYPADKDRFVIFGASRLFEQIQVMRKNFRPAGYWQGITWENQDVRLSSVDQLNAQLMALVDSLAAAFAKRYKEYNPIPGHPGETGPIQPAGGITLPSTPPTTGRESRP